MKAIFTAFFAVIFSYSILAAQDTLYIYKSGAVVVKQAVAEIDSIIFYDATTPLYISQDFTKEGIFTSGCEGPAVDSKGNLYAVNLEKSGTIAIIDSTGNARIFSTLPEGSTGNGIRFDRQDNMYIADYTGHNVLMIPAGDSAAGVYVHNSSFNQPNDLAIMSNGILFASDPNWGNNNGKLWRIGTDKIPVLLDANLGTTNGIEVSNDETRLYVNESAQLKIWKFDLNEMGEISNKKLFTSFTDFGLDGMRCDADGNLFVSRYGKGVIAVFSPDGNLIREIHLKGNDVSNIAFGGADGRTCYVTMQDRKMIEMFRTETPGREWKLIHSPE
jgi:gluconolactonase